jgi:hypothetical protein
MKKTTNSLIGSTLTITPGTRVTRNGIVVTQKRTRNVTVRATELARNGKTRIIWTSMGYRTSTLIG